METASEHVLDKLDSSIRALDDILPEINEDIFLYNNNDSKYAEISEGNESISTVINQNELANPNNSITEDLVDYNDIFDPHLYTDKVADKTEIPIFNEPINNIHLTKRKVTQSTDNIMELKQLQEDFFQDKSSKQDNIFSCSEKEEVLKLSQFKDNAIDVNFPYSELMGDIKIHEEKCNKNCTYGKNMSSSKSSSNPTIISFLYFLKKQLFPTYYSPDTNDASYVKKCQKVSTLFKIPLELEIFSAYGILQCTNSFLQLFTFLPLRFIVVNFRLFSMLIVAFLYILTKPFKRSSHYSTTNIFKSKFLATPLNSSEICDLLKGYLLLFGTLAFYMIDTSIIYHLVRGQAIIKLYIFFNMLEVGDRLCNSLGQDILESLYWAAAVESDTESNESKKRHKKHLGLFIHFALALIYLFIHSFVVLLQATTLSVAFNSHNKALLTIMISNNFVELKGNVFKKFEKANLFQMSCSDVRERFSLVIMMAIVMLRNLTEFSWSTEHFFQLFPDMVIVMMAEMLVDWVKHAFITKFNEIPHEVYKEFTNYLAKDVIGNNALYNHTKMQSPIPTKGDDEICKTINEKNNYCDNTNSKSDGDKVAKGKVNFSIFTDNNSDLVCKQTGFTPLPLAIIFIKTLCQTFIASYTIFKSTNYLAEIKTENFLNHILQYVNYFAITLSTYYPDVNILNIMIFILIYINLFFIKIWISILVLGLAYDITTKEYIH